MILLARSCVVDFWSDKFSAERVLTNRSKMRRDGPKRGHHVEGHNAVGPYMELQGMYRIRAITLLKGCQEDID